MVSSKMVTLAEVQAAQTRIAPYVRRTPTMTVNAVRDPLYTAGRLSLKLESLQVTGAFKARGAVNKLLSLSERELQAGVITASSGNHALAVAYAAWRLGARAIIYVPTTTPASKIERMRQWGAHIVVKGDFFHEANAAALITAAQQGQTFVHAFDDPDIIAGQGTIGPEIVEDLPDVDVILIAVGGGGLISGISLAAKTLKPDITIIGVEPTGAPTLHQSLDAGRVVELDKVETRVGTLGAKCLGDLNFEISREYVDEVVLVTDDEMLAASRWLWRELNLAAELSGSAAMAALLTGRYVPAPGQHVCVLVCGAGADGVGN